MADRTGKEPDPTEPEVMPFFVFPKDVGALTLRGFIAP